MTQFFFQMELIDMMAAERGIDPDLDLRINPLALVDLRDDFEAQGLIHVVHAPASFTHPHSLSELAACAPQVIQLMYLAQEIRECSPTELHNYSTIQQKMNQ